MTGTVPDLARRLSRASATASFSVGGGHGEKFTSRFQFLIVLVGYAVGIGNLWRFPYLCGKYGGGTFLVPYFVGNIFVAGPLLMYEVGLGQHFQGGPEVVFDKIAPRFVSMATLQWMLTVLLSCYYPMVIGYALSYAAYSLCPTSDGNLPWVTLNQTSGNASTPQAFWDENILMGTDGILSEGWWIPSPVPLISLTFVWAVTGVILLKGVETMAKIGTVMVFLPVFILLVFLVFSVQLDGAGDGIEFYVQPNFTKLMEGEIWGVGISQTLFSLSPAMGPGMVFGACNDRSHSTIVSDIFIVTVANASFSIIGGFTIFSILGFLARLQNVPVATLAGSGQGLAFVTIAGGVTHFPASRFVSFSFFFMLFMLGLDSLVPWAETVFHPFFEFYMKQKDFSRARIVVKGCICMWLTGVPFTLRSGKHWMLIFDHYAPVYVLLGSALIEYLLIMKYGTGKVIWIIKEMTTVELPKVMVLQAMVAPFFLAVIFLYSLQGDIADRDCTLPMVNRTLEGGGWEEHCPGVYMELNGNPVFIDIIFGWLAVFVPFGAVAYGVATYTPSFESEKAREIELA